jgi:predicted O-methyltransferase YrrM
MRASFLTLWSKLRSKFALQYTVQGKPLTGLEQSSLQPVPASKTPWSDQRDSEGFAFEVDETSQQRIDRVRALNLSYCGPPKLENLAAALSYIKAHQVSGDIVEAGVALGGSAIVLALGQDASRTLWLYDVFAMIPSPGDQDEQDAHERFEVIRSGQSKGIGDHLYYGYRTDLKSDVESNLRSFGIEPGNGVHLVKGLFQDTLYPKTQIALAHVDCDWFESVKVCIDRITPRLSPGGLIVFDDYTSYRGCRKAVDAWLNEAQGFRVVGQRRSLLVQRIGS